jgi:acyl-coenzyme A thioesterase PaaI-like protein
MTDDLLEEDTAAPPAGFMPMQWSRGFGRQVGPFYHRSEGGENFTRAFLVAEHHTNGMMNCHGGMLMAFADTVFGHPISIRCPQHYWVTVRMLTDFLSGARQGEWVFGTSHIVGQDGDMFTVEGRIFTGERIVMTGTGIFKTLGPRPERR